MKDIQLGFWSGFVTGVPMTAGALLLFAAAFWPVPLLLWRAWRRQPDETA